MHWTLIKVIETVVYYIPSFMKRSSCSNKLRCEEYLKLICKCLSDDMYIQLACKRIPYAESTYVYRKANMIVV